MGLPRGPILFPQSSAYAIFCFYIYGDTNALASGSSVVGKEAENSALEPRSALGVALCGWNALACPARTSALNAKLDRPFFNGRWYIKQICFD